MICGPDCSPPMTANGQSNEILVLYVELLETRNLPSVSKFATNEASFSEVKCLVDTFFKFNNLERIWQSSGE